MHSAEPTDMVSLKDQLNQDYQDKLRRVNDEAEQKIRLVQEEHKRRLRQTEEMAIRQRRSGLQEAAER